MLTYFPLPYQDELLYSVIARYGIHCGITSSKQLLSDLFSKSDVTAAVDFPGHLKTFVGCLGRSSSLSVEDWIQHHTLYPAYLAFSPAERQQQILKSARSNNAGNVHTRLGRCAFYLKPPEYLRLCKQCMIEQQERLGEAYWQRCLQLPGVVFCPHHELPLYISNTPYHPVEKFDFNAAEYTQIVKSLDSDALWKSKNLLVPLARNLNTLLQTSYNRKMSFEKLSNFYVDLAEKNDLTKGSRVDHIRVEEKFHSYWKEPCPEIFPEVFESDRDWLKNLFRKHRKSFHPLCHLMVWHAFNLPDSLSTLDYICRLPAHKNQVVTRIPLKPSDQINAHRKQWTSIRVKNPDKGVKLLRQQKGVQALYAWLYRNDRDWLQNNTPKAFRKVLSGPRVDWDKRDRELLEVLKYLDNTTSDATTKIRKSKTWYMKNSVNRSMLEKHLNKLPLCKNFIDSNSETVEKFHQRRIKDAIRELKAEGSALPMWKIIRRAGIREEFITDDFRKFIQDITET